MKAHGLFAIVVFLAACRAGGPEEPGTAWAEIVLTVPDGVTPGGPLRFAVAWRQGSAETQHWITTYDAPIDLLAEALLVPLDLPSEAEFATLSDLSQVRVQCGVDAASSYWPVAIPRLVVYEDVDGNGSLNADLPYSPGVDRIWAIGGIGSVASEIVAFLDLDEALSTVGLEMSECVRDLTLGLYVPFLMVQGYVGYVEPTGVALSATLGLSPTDYPRVAMGCEDDGAAALAGDYGNWILGSREVAVDDAISDDLCAMTTLTCGVDDFDGIVAPDLTVASHPGFTETTRCAAQGSLDILWHRELALVCEGCSCQRVEKGNLWVASVDDLPDWWPCGFSVEYCAGQQSDIWSPMGSCALEEKRPE